MQVLVKTKNAKIEMKGDIPNDILTAVSKAFKKSVKILNDDGEEIVLATQSKWFNEIIEGTSPGKVIHIYRENSGLSQSQLGEKVKKSIQYISDLENDRRNISLDMARKLAKVFDISIARLLN
ncbi:MAG: helix-turn-helix transcriptional regulator [Leptospirales bacterium]